MAVDIVPQLIENIDKDFYESLNNNERLKVLKDKLESNKATYKDAHEYAVTLGDLLTNALGTNVTSDTLPDGTMYFNIAERVIRPYMTNNHNMVADYAVGVQTLANEMSGLAINAVTPELNEDKIDGIINRVSSEPFENVSWILGEPIVNFTESVVDDTIETNCNWQSKAGIKPIITRTTQANCCKWCASLDGIYNYPEDVPKDVYRRHENCRCLTEYIGNGKIQNVWSKATLNNNFSKMVAPPQVANQPQNLNDLRKNTSKLAGSMPSTQYDRAVDAIKNGNDGITKIYERHGDEISYIVKTAHDGAYNNGTKSIQWCASFDESSEFSCLFHEYGHFFDNLDDLMKNLSYREINAVQQATRVSSKAGYFRTTASKSDEFLGALRKDKKHIKDNYTKQMLYELKKDNQYTAGVQDGIDGLFGQTGIEMHWVHGNEYYNKTYNTCNDKKALQTVYKLLGYDASNQVKTKDICRDYRTASELWANQISALTVNDAKELKYMEEFFPNTLAEMKRILSLV